MGTTDRKQITGDIVWNDKHSDGWYIAAALLLLFPPTMPLGAFIGGYIVFDCLEFE